MKRIPELELCVGGEIAGAVDASGSLASLSTSWIKCGPKLLLIKLGMAKLESSVRRVGF